MYSKYCILYLNKFFLFSIIGCIKQFSCPIGYAELIVPSWSRPRPTRPRPNMVTRGYPYNKKTISYIYLYNRQGKPKNCVPGRLNA